MTPETIRYEAVYPGHTITVGLAILWRYGNLTAAKEEALGDSQIPGAGRCVRSALTVLEECWRGATIAEIQALAADIWRHCDEQWIGTGWCIDRGASGDGQRGYGDSRTDKPPPASIPIQLPHLGNAGRGIHRKLPLLGNAGVGIHRKLPHLGSAGRGPLAVLTELAERLRRVRVACGDWSRVLGGSVTWRLGITGIVLDPPYAEGNMEYATGVSGVSAEVGAWARENGDHALLRIAVCGLDGEHHLPGWECVPWKARGGYGSQRRDGSNDNRERERIWFSPHCLKPDKAQIAMFGAP